MKQVEYMVITDDRFELPIYSWHSLKELHGKISKNSKVCPTLDMFYRAVNKDVRIWLNGERVKVISVMLD